MKLGAVTSAGKPVTARVHDADDPRAARRDPRRGPVGRRHRGLRGDAALVADRLELAVHPDERHRRRPPLDPWVSRDVPFDRPNHGDPSVTPVSPRVRVAITSDRALAYASTGEPVSKSGLTTTIEATNVRDFVFSAAPTTSISSTVGGVTVRVYYRPGFPASSVLAQARHAIAAYEPLVGDYRYPVYDLAQSAGYGMESPGDLDPDRDRSSNLAYLVHHETAHQWFYGIVGNDQAYEPFTDEAVTDFLARYVLGQKRASRCSTGRLDMSIYRYSSIVLLRDRLHPGRQLHRRPAADDGLDPVLERAPGVHRPE